MPRCACVMTRRATQIRRHRLETRLEASAPATTRRRRRSLVVLAGVDRTSDAGARALAASLAKAGIQVSYIGREPCARRIATAAAQAGVDAIEVCVAGGGSVVLLRELLRELKEIDRGGVHIVVHRVH
jgi:methylmalonyl-CoA mutase cobalamin-binding domain/chain